MTLAQATEPRLDRERAPAVGEDGVFKCLIAGPDFRNPER